MRNDQRRGGILGAGMTSVCVSDSAGNTDRVVGGCEVDICPRCLYPRRGLPDHSRCPECGLHFDAASRMWMVYPKLPSNPLEIPLLVLAVIIVVTSWGNWTWPLRWVMAILFFAAFAMPVITRAKRRRRRLPVLAACVPEGVVYRLGGANARMILWDDLVRAEKGRILKQPNVILYFNQSRSARTLAGMFEGDSDVDEFLAECDRRVHEAARRREAGAIDG